MTRVQLRFALENELDTAALGRIADAQSIYGVEHIKVESSASGVSNPILLVEYDASRLKPPEVESALRKLGLAATPIAN